MRVEFEKNRPVEHLPIIDGLIFKGTQNLIEAVSLFQQENHLMDAFDKQSREDVRALQEASFSLSNTFSRKDVSTGSNLVQNIAEKDSLEIVSRPGSTFLFNFLRKNAAQ